MPKPTINRKETIQRLLAAAERTLSTSASVILPKVCGQYGKADFERLLAEDANVSELTLIEEHVMACPACLAGFLHFSEAERDRLENEKLLQIACRVLDRVLPEAVPVGMNIVLRYLQGMLEMVTSSMQVVPLQTALAVRGSNEAAGLTPRLLFRQDIPDSSLSVEASFSPDKEREGEIALTFSLYDTDQDSFITGIQVELSGPTDAMTQETDSMGLTRFILPGPGIYKIRFSTRTGQIPLLITQVEIQPVSPADNGTEKS